MTNSTFTGRDRKKSNLHRAWEKWALSLDDHNRLTAVKRLGHERVESLDFKIPYLKYDNVLILPQKALRNPLIESLLSNNDTSKLIAGLWEAIANEFHVSHVGVTAPISLVAGVDHSEAKFTIPEMDVNGTNVLRSPTSFQPLHGAWGQAQVLYSNEAAENAFWARATQHGVTQVWSPLHTMFSNGNISEKARVMRFGREKGTTAVDLYAGIGYFALFYRKYVADVMLCWEINPWSVEGFRRGAAANGWAKETTIVRTGSDHATRLSGAFDADETSKARLIMFEESNQHAIERVRGLKTLPPVRHVNCGYLPTSSPSWRTAAHLIVAQAGEYRVSRPANRHGWVHAHENIAIKDIQSRTAEVVSEFQTIIDELIAPQRDQVLAQASCDHVAQVKTYAPGVMHCVLDIRIEVNQKAPG